MNKEEARLHIKNFDAIVKNRLGFLGSYNLVLKYENEEYIEYFDPLKQFRGQIEIWHIDTLTRIGL
jgi:hypothetical protein